MTARWRRKNNRLAPDAYVGPNAYLVTSATEGRRPRFTEASFVDVCLEKLVEAAELEAMDVLAYVFMPDHCHLLLLGRDEAYLASFMKRFKQTTGFWFKGSTGGVLWQKSYHDHVLRRDEDLEDVAAYIAMNPVRAGLVGSWEDYPFTGGPAFDGRPDGDLKVAATSPPMSGRQQGNMA